MAPRSALYPSPKNSSLRSNFSTLPQEEGRTRFRLGEPRSRLSLAFLLLAALALAAGLLRRLLWHFFAFGARFGEADCDGLLAARDLSAFATLAASQRAFVAFLHRAFHVARCA